MSFATFLAYNDGDPHSFLSQYEDTSRLEQEGVGGEESQERFGVQTGGGEGLGYSVEESKDRTGGEDVEQENKVAERAGYSPPGEWQEG